MMIQNVYHVCVCGGGVDRKQAEFIGNKQTYRHSTVLLVQTRIKDTATSR